MTFTMLGDDEIAAASVDELWVAIAAADRFRAQLDGYEARLHAAATRAGAAASAGERGMDGALPKRTKMSRHEARRRARAARAVEEHPELGEAMADGDLNIDQVNDLAAADVPDGVRRSLADQAKRQSADETRRAVRSAERESRERRGEDASERQRRLRGARTFTDRDDMFNLQARFDAETGARIAAALTAANRRLWQSDKATGDPASVRSPAQRLADAVADLIESGVADRPASTSDRARRQPMPVSLQVSIDYSALIGLLGPVGSGTTADGTPLPAATLRRLACDAEVIPAVFGGPSAILDLGRATRTVTAAQRAALALRDGGCRWPGCTAPPSMCDAHHVRHWADGGPTDLGNLILLCRHHHHLLHEGGYVLWPDGSGGFDLHTSGGVPHDHLPPRWRAGPAPPPGSEGAPQPPDGGAPRTRSPRRGRSHSNQRMVDAALFDETEVGPSFADTG